MNQAKTRYLENRRREILLAQVERWREAEAISTATRRRISTATTTGHASGSHGLVDMPIG